MNKRSYLEYLALAALLVTFFGYFAVRVWDIDFWWHIAAGRNILESGAIPGTDPFGVYDAASSKGQTVLKSQWLGQVLLYSVFRWFDLDGIILFRAGVLTLCLVIVYLRCRIAGTASLYGLGITALAGMAILPYTGERPQLFSFLCLSLIFLLLDRFMANGRRWQLYCIPLVMLLWSNAHGGAVLGMVALGLFGAAYVLEYRLAEGRFDTPQIKLMIIVVVLSAVTLVLAPNGLETIRYLVYLESSSIPIRERTSEYASPWELWRTALYYWVFMVAALVSLPGFLKREYWKQGGVVVAIGAISVTAYRYIPLFVLLAAPYVAASLERLSSRLKPPAVAVNLSVLIVSLALLGYGIKQGRVFQHGILENKFPAGAVAFIKANQLGGRIFSSMNWGGYLIWNLPDKVNVFIDGRVLDPERMIPYTHILWTTPDGQRFFEQQNFDLALVPYGNVFTGEHYPLVDYLKHRPDWLTAYRDATGYLFVRRESGAH
ncbi:MAG: hypothetical protein ACOY9D_13095 [Pseudomonadota bacterium]